MISQAAWADDWRNRGQECFLANEHLQRMTYQAPSDIWTHDHCEFCWATFSEYGEQDLREGYTTDDHYHWICDDCYNDLKELFHWSVD